MRWLSQGAKHFKSKDILEITIVNSEGLIGCVIGLSLVFSLLTVVFLMGYGLVEIPISYFRYASNNKKLQHYQCKVAEYDQKLRDKAKKSQTLIEIIKYVKVEPELEDNLKVIRADVEDFQEQVD